MKSRRNLFVLTLVLFGGLFFSVAAQESPFPSETVRELASEESNSSDVSPPAVSPLQPQQTLSQPEMTKQATFASLPQIQQPVNAIVPNNNAYSPVVPGAIVIPVTVPQYMTYMPPPSTVMMNRPAQLVISPTQMPQQMMPYPPQPGMYPMMQQPYMPQQMYPQSPMMSQPMAAYAPQPGMYPMMQQSYMPQQMYPQSPMMGQAAPNQPIPVKMILPDGSTVSIKHYVPGSYFRNAIRAVTP